MSKVLHTKTELDLGLPFHHHLVIGVAFSKTRATKCWLHSRVCEESEMLGGGGTCYHTYETTSLLEGVLFLLGILT